MDKGSDGGDNYDQTCRADAAKPTQETRTNRTLSSQSESSITTTPLSCDSRRHDLMPTAISIIPTCRIRLLVLLYLYVRRAASGDGVKSDKMNRLRLKIVVVLFDQDGCKTQRQCTSFLRRIKN